MGSSNTPTVQGASAQIEESDEVMSTDNSLDQFPDTPPPDESQESGPLPQEMIVKVQKIWPQVNPIWPISESLMDKRHWPFSILDSLFS